MIVTNGEKSSINHLHETSTLMEDHDTHWSFIAFAMKFTHDTDNVSTIGRAILTFIGEKDAAHKKKKEEQICMIGRQLTNIAEGK